MHERNQIANWAPDPFETNVVRRSDGCLIFQPRQELPSYPSRTMDALERWAADAPTRTFIAQRGPDGAWLQLTYSETLERVKRIAEGLLGRDLSADRPIAILSGNSIEHLLLAFAATWAGIPYCPVSPAYSQSSGTLDKLRFVLELLTPGLVAAFDTTAYERALQLVPPQTPIVGDLPSVCGRELLSLAGLQSTTSPALAAAHARTGPDTIVKFLLTSGSTAEPKAVITTHRMLCSNAQMLRQALPFVAVDPPVLVDWLPWNHTFGGSHNVGLVLFNGGSLYVDAGKPTAAGFAPTVRNLLDVSPTVYFNVPKGYDLLAHQLKQDEQLRRSFFRRLRAYFFAGASLAQHTMDALDDIALRECGRRIPMLSGLGATETSPSVTFTTPSNAGAGGIGLPAAGNVVKLAPCEGKLEIRVKGPNVTPGYWRRPDLTVAAFDEEGYYRLGDAARLLDESEPTKGLRFDGRIAEDFKLSSGTWVSVGPLRATLIAAFSPFIQDVGIAGLDRDYLAVLLIPDVAACAASLRLQDASHEQILAHGGLRALLHERLEAHAACHPASSHCVRRAMLLPSAPSLDQGEITDKGSINQRALLRHRAECVALLYRCEPPDSVIRVD